MCVGWEICKSNHPTQHKYSAIRFLYGRLNSYHLDKEEYQQEENIIQNILHNNSFPLTFHKRYTPKQQLPHQPQENKHKWTTFMYFGKETMYITNLFKHSNLQIALHTNNTLQHHLIYNTQNPDKFTCSRFNKLICPNCKKAYIGQQAEISLPGIMNINVPSEIILAYQNLHNT